MATIAKSDKPMAGKVAGENGVKEGWEWIFEADALSEKGLFVGEVEGV